MSDKFFNVNKPDTVVTIISEQANFYKLSDGNMIQKDSFMSKYQPILPGFENERITQPTPQYNNVQVDAFDPSTFFSKPSVSLDDIKKISNVDTSKVSDIRPEASIKKIDEGGNVIQQPTPQIYNESLVSQVSNLPIPNNTKTDVSQYKVYDDDDDAYNDFVNKSKSVQVEQKSVPVTPKTNSNEQEIELLYQDEILMFGQEEADLRKNKRLGRGQKAQQTNNTPQTMQTPQLDPVTMMFSTFKRNHEITINVEFKDKIGKPDFIKMMIENMEGDIVGYYKKLIMDNIKKDLSKIEYIVEKELRLQIFGEEELKDNILEETTEDDLPVWSAPHITQEEESPKKKTKKTK